MNSKVIQIFISFIMCSIAAFSTKVSSYVCVGDDRTFLTVEHEHWDGVGKIASMIVIG